MLVLMLMLMLNFGRLSGWSVPFKRVLERRLNV